MDAGRWNGLSNPLSRVGTRRSALLVLAVLPILGSLTALLGEEATEIAFGRPGGRRKHRKSRRRQKRRRIARRKRDKGDGGLALSCSGAKG